MNPEEMTELVKTYIFKFTWETNFKIITVTRRRFQRRNIHIYKTFQQLIDEDYHGFVDLAIQGHLIEALKKINYYKFIDTLMQLREIERLHHTERVRLFVIMKNLINTSNVDDIHEIINMGDVREFGGLVSIDIK